MSGDTILIFPLTPENAGRMHARKMAERDPATCRCCGRLLRGHAYMYGGTAYHPDTGEQCGTNKYGGFVCSDICDQRATYDLEASQPGNHMGRRRP